MPALGEKAGRAVDELNHPLPFVIFTTLAVLGFAAIATHLFKQMGMPGPAAFFQTP